MIDKPSTPASQPDYTLPPPKPRGSGFAIFVASLALIFTIIGVGAGYRHWQRMHDQLEGTQAELKRVQQQLDQTPTQAALEAVQQKVTTQLQDHTNQAQATLQAVTTLAHQTEQFASSVDSQVKQVTELQGQLQTTHPINVGQNWQLAQVEYLLTLADRELRLAHNKVSALAALKEADQLLMMLGEVNYLTIRQKLAQDIGALESYQATDLAKLTQQINDLRQALKPPLLTPELLISQKADSASQSAQANEPSVWQRYKQEAQSLFQESFVIRDLDKPLDIQLTADASMQLYQLLLQRIETLYVLALKEDTLAFNQQAEVIDSTIQAYYPEPQASLLLVKLNTLKASIAQTDKPDITNGLRALKNLSLTSAEVSS